MKIKYYCPHCGAIRTYEPRRDPNFRYKMLRNTHCGNCGYQVMITDKDGNFKVKTSNDRFVWIGMKQ